MKKLTLISIRFRGRLHSVFVDAPVVDGKTMVSQAVLDKLLDSIGVRRGDTYSFG